MTNIIEKPDDEDKIESQSDETKTEEIKEPTNENVSSETNVTAEEKPDDVDDFEIVLPGMRLRQLREKDNVSVKHIADRLFLDIGVIERLEADDYEHLPPPIFIRGYMRNYAKLLGIKPESITDDFDPEGRQPKLHPQMKREEQTNRHDLLPTLATIAVIITLLVLAVMWRPSPEPSLPTELLPDQQVDEPPILLPELPKPEESSEGVINNTDGQPVVGEPTSNETSIAETPPVNDKTIKIHFKARSWIRVVDKTNATLHDGISSGGKVLSFDGTPPFFIKVGNIDGINVEYKGEIKDVTTYPKRSGQRNLFIIGSESP